MPSANNFIMAAALAAASFAPSARAEAMQAIMVRAIDAGTSQGEVTGYLADRWMGITKSSSPVMANAKVVKRFQQAGCARLAITIRQEGVLTRAGTYAPFQTGWELNLCRDGSHPVEGVDNSAAQKFFSILEQPK